MNGLFIEYKNNHCKEDVEAFIAWNLSFIGLAAIIVQGLEDRPIGPELDLKRFSSAYNIVKQAGNY